MLIAEAEKAAEALEVAAQTSSHAQASLIESRMLIAEANQLIASLEVGDEVITFENDTDPSEDSDSTMPAPNLEKERDGHAQIKEAVEPIKVNGSHSISPSLIDSTEDFSFNKFLLPDLLNGNGNGSSSFSNDTLKTEETLSQKSNGSLPTKGNGNGLSSCLNDALKTEEKRSQTSNGSLSPEASNSYSISTKNAVDLKLNPNGIPVNGLELESEKEEAPDKQPKIVKKWVRGRLVEVAEEA